jgi:signal peptidase II
VTREQQSGTGRPRFRSLAFSIAAAIVLLDRFTKIYIRHHFNSFDAVEVLPGWFRLVHTENPGAAFGMLAEGNPILRSIVLVGVSGAVLLFVIATLLKPSNGASGWAMRIGLGFILGGAVGNLYDRVAIGTVTDFLEVYHGSWSFPAFNAADSAITVGAVLLLIDLFWKPHRKQVASRPI